MTGWGSNHHPPISSPSARDDRRDKSDIIADDRGEHHVLYAYFIYLVDSMLASETVLLLLLAFLLSMIPLMFL